MSNLGSGIAGCSRDWCTSPDGYGGYDCAAPPAWGEACSCSQGSAHVVETEAWEDTTLYWYTCCTSGADVELQGDSCGVRRPTVAIVVGVVLAVLVHIGSIVFMCMWLAKWKAKAAGVPEAAVVTPFQVVKVRLQAKEHLGRYHGTLHCLRTVLAEEGPRALAFRHA